MAETNCISYLKGLGGLLVKTECCLASGNKLTLEEGLDKTVKILSEQANKGKKILMIGNGGSASIASHISVDFWKNGRMRAQAFNDTSLLTCIANDFGYPYVFEKPVEMFADEGDPLIAISSSGKSENILRGAQAAKAKNCPVITMSGFDQGNPLKSLGDVNFYVPSQAGEYGYVEIVHSALCHCFVDIIINRKLIK